LGGEVLSQIIFESPFSIGDMMMASKKIRKKATENIISIPPEARIASNMTGMTASCGFFDNIHWCKHTTMTLKMKALIMATAD
jgi:hypothetical protein